MGMPFSLRNNDARWIEKEQLECRDVLHIRYDLVTRACSLPCRLNDALTILSPIPPHSRRLSLVLSPFASTYGSENVVRRADKRFLTHIHYRTAVDQRPYIARQSQGLDSPRFGTAYPQDIGLPRRVDNHAPTDTLT